MNEWKLLLCSIPSVAVFWNITELLSNFVDKVSLSQFSLSYIISGSKADKKLAI